VEVNADGSAAPESVASASCQEVCAPQVHQVTQQKEHWEGLFNTVQAETDALKKEKETLEARVSQHLQAVADLQSKVTTLQQDSESRITALQHHVEEFQNRAAEANDQLEAAHEMHKTKVEEAKRSLLDKLEDAKETITLLQKQIAELEEKFRQHKESRFHIDVQGIIQDFIALVKGKALKKTD
jgi:chromosome segregation ATPase